MSLNDVAQSLEEQVVVFYLSNQAYGADISRVYEIIRLEPITGIPHAPDFIEGIIKLRGKVLPVVDLRQRFLLPPSENNDQSRIMIVDVNRNTIGITVDAVSEVLRLPSSVIETPPPVIKGVDAVFLRGIAHHQERLILLLDIETILAENEKEQLQKAELNPEKLT